MSVCVQYIFNVIRFIVVGFHVQHFNRNKIEVSPNL
jgi:hypothetical protein